MTLSSELFLTPAYTAPQGSSRDSLGAAKSSASDRPQKIDREVKDQSSINQAGINQAGIKEPEDNSNDRFKDHLSRETARDIGQESPNTEDQIPENNGQADKNIEGTTAVPVQKENIRAEIEIKSEFILQQANILVGNKTEGALPSKQGSIAQGNSEIIANIKPDLQTGLTQNNMTKADGNITEANGNITEANKAQSTENTGNTFETSAKLATLNTPRAISAEKNPPIILSNAAQSRQQLPAVNIEDNPKANLSTDLISEGTPKQENVPSSQNTSGADPALTQKADIQNAPPQIIDMQNSAVQDEARNLPPGPPVNAAQALSESAQNQSGTPQQNLAAVPVQATNQRPADPLKDTVKPSLKGGGNSPASEGSDSKNQVASSENSAKAKGSSKNSAESQYSSQNASSASAASPANNQSINSQMGAKAVPFQAELNAAMTNRDIRPPQLNNPPLQATLLSIQEVGQQNNLASTSHIKPPTLPVTPQMVTKQISMAILKQAGNGLNSFKLSLKPAELGQVNIRMDFQADGKVTTAVIVDNDRTLALLQRDQGALSRALENAGFDMGGNNLNFTLKKQQHDQSQSNFSDNNTGDGENEDLPHNLDNIVNRQQLKMAYSDNALDINI
ncbi:MAG: flagellar hook-length control protein FliK [Emcibacter sp.]|nr:flagellar hook-length control protein FliK [Emcibacter sp.]